MHSILQHLRFPFSFLLMPVFVLAVLTAPDALLSASAQSLIILFIGLHVFIYPSSNAYNSYQDKDTGSIGLIKTPLPTSKGLFYITILFDLIGLILIVLYCPKNTVVLILLYIVASKGYSWRKIRLKKHPILGFLTVFLFQGALIYQAVISSIGGNIFEENHLKMAIISSLLFGGAYPLTQIYQHESDQRDGVKTLSMLLGIQGTFIFSGTLFIAGFLGLLYCTSFELLSIFWVYSLVFLLPIIGYFVYWQWLCLKNKSEANYKNTMRAILLSALCMNLMVVSLLILKLSH
jgi:1,4-dihydroxy-2-naphthoate polyprenyltransferase